MYDPIGSVLGAWSAGDGLWAIAFRLALALTFGAVLGCERAAKRHAAGLRTFVLVCMSGTAAMTLDRASGGLPLISAAVVLGIAIISTNSILFSSKSQIRGLTTATGLWSCSLLGLALGAGLYTLAALGFAAILACLSWLPAFETATGYIAEVYAGDASVLAAAAAAGEADVLLMKRTDASALGTMTHYPLRYELASTSHAVI